MQGVFKRVVIDQVLTARRNIREFELTTIALDPPAYTGAPPNKYAHEQCSGMEVAHNPTSPKELPDFVEHQPQELA